MQIRKMISLLKQCSSNIKPFIKQNIAFIVLTECVVLFGLGIPLIMRFLIDDVLSADRWNMFPGFVIIMSTAIILSKLFSIVTNILYNRFAANIEENARNSLFLFITRKNLSFFHKTPDGEIVDRLMRSPEQLHTIPSIYLERLISSCGTIIIVFFILFSINPVMASASLIAVPVFIIIYLKTRTLFFTQVQKAREECGRLTDFYTSTIRNIKQVKNMCLEEDIQNSSIISNRRIKQLGLKYAITGAFVNNSVNMITQFNQLGIVIYGALLIHNGQMTIGTLVAFYTYLDLLYQPIISIIQALNEMNSALVNMERYLEFFNHENEEDYECPKNVPFTSSDVCFSHVDFSYGDNLVLKDVSFHIASSEKVLLIGQSGIGKSTLAALMKRFYYLENGNITIGGIDIRNYPLTELRKSIMYVTQDDYFFPATIRENFKKIDPDIDDEAIMNALEKAQLYHDIFCPGKNGLDTTLEKNAAAFSGGQRRRLSLALMFASKAPIVVLDEPFTGLDHNTQSKLCEEVEQFLQNKTAIIIDHNFPDTEYFQRIFEINANYGITEKIQ